MTDNVAGTNLGFQDSVISGLDVPALYGDFALCKREGSIVIGDKWFTDKFIILTAKHGDTELHIMDSTDSPSDSETPRKRKTTHKMKELLWVNNPSLNARAVDEETGEPYGFDLIFRTHTLTLVESSVFNNPELSKMTHTLKNVLINWKPSVKSANLLKINRFGAVQRRWYMLENNVDLSWYKNRLAVNSRNSVKINTLLKVTVPSANPKARKYPLSADLIFSSFKKEKIYHLAALADAPSEDLLRHILRHWTLEDLELVEPSEAEGTNMVCILDLHLETVNAKLATSPDDFGFNCAVFPPMANAPADWTGQSEQHIRVIELPSSFRGTKGAAETAGMWMHDAILAIDGHKISTLSDLKHATAYRSRISVRLARLPFRRNVKSENWPRIVRREKARRLTLGYQKNWTAGVDLLEVKQRSRKRWLKKHAKTKFHPWRPRSRKNGHDTNDALDSAISEQLMLAMERAELKMKESPRWGTLVGPPKEFPPSEKELSIDIEESVNQWGAVSPPVSPHESISRVTPRAESFVVRRKTHCQLPL